MYGETNQIDKFKIYIEVNVERIFHNSCYFDVELSAQFDNSNFEDNVWQIEWRAIFNGQNFEILNEDFVQDPNCNKSALEKYNVLIVWMKGVWTANFLVHMKHWSIMKVIFKEVTS